MARAVVSCAAANAACADFPCAKKNRERGRKNTARTVIHAGAAAVFDFENRAIGGIQTMRDDARARFGIGHGDMLRAARQNHAGGFVVVVSGGERARFGAVGRDDGGERGENFKRGRRVGDERQTAARRQHGIPNDMRRRRRARDGGDGARVRRRSENADFDRRFGAAQSRQQRLELRPQKPRREREHGARVVEILGCDGGQRRERNRAQRARGLAIGGDSGAAGGIVRGANQDRDAGRFCDRIHVYAFFALMSAKLRLALQRRNRIARRRFGAGHAVGRHSAELDLPECGSRKEDFEMVEV